MNRIHRLFGITTLLQSKKYSSADRIAKLFGISVRTVYRDIRALSEQGIPVSFEPNRGYFLVRGYFLPPVTFTAQEANALLLLESVVAVLSDQSIQTHYSTALQKVKAVLPDPEKDRIEEFRSSIKIQFPEYLDGNFDYLATLQSALSGQQIIEVEYTNKNGITSQRQVEPIGLAFYNFSWHLIGWCHRRHAYRDFRVSRIRRLKSTSLPFKKSPHLTLADYIADLNLPYAV